MHTSTKVLEGIMDAEYFAVLLELEEKGGHWTFDEDCDKFYFNDRCLIHLFDAPWLELEEPEFETHPEFDEMVWAKRK